MDFFAGGSVDGTGVEEGGRSFEADVEAAESGAGIMWTAEVADVEFIISSALLMLMGLLMFVTVGTLVGWFSDFHNNCWPNPVQYEVK